jgi:hypothetical protein
MSELGDIIVHESVPVDAKGYLTKPVKYLRKNL